MNKKEEHLYLTACSRKRRYTSWEVAEEAIRELESRPEPPDRPLNVYHCRFCFGLHIGRQSGRRPNAR